MRVTAWVLLAIGTSFSTVAYAGPGIWTSGGPYGGDVRALAINPTTPATVYAGTNGGGVFKSTDSGATWTYAGLANLVLAALAINPAAPATLYAGTNGGVFKSTDAGSTWAAANTGLTTPEGDLATPVNALAINPTTSATLYAGTHSGVFKSTDSGGTWSAVNTGLSPNFLSVNALAINPTTPSTLYAGTDRGGVFKSTSSGDTWTRASTGLNFGVSALAINPATPVTLYAGAGGNGIFKSTDSGGTWAATGVTKNGFALAIDPTAPTTLYAGEFKSTDAGVTWSAANTQLAESGVSALAINPATPATLYAGTIGGGVFKSADAGVTWSATNTGMTSLHVLALAIDPSRPTVLYAGTVGSGVVKSTDSGGTWSASGEPRDLTVQALAIDPSTPATLYAGTYGGGVFKSTDSGATWGATGASLANAVVYALAINPAIPATLYAGVSSWVFRSTDSGATWIRASEGLTTNSVHALAIDPKNPSTLYAGTYRESSYSSGVFKSTDSGGTWTAANAGLRNSDDIRALAINPTTPATLYAGTGRGVFKSTDAGATWVAANAGLTNPNVRALAINPATPATLYAGAYRGGIFRSTDSGSVWAEANAGLTILTVDALALDPTGATTVYAGFVGGGVWQATPATLSVNALLPTSAHSTGLGGAFYTTNVSVSNGGGSPASFTLKFLGHDQDGSEGPEQTLSLDAGKSVTYLDVLGSVFNQTSNFGAIRITSNSAALDIVSVTSTPGFGGTFGQTIPAVSTSDLIPAGSSRSIPYIREGDGFRSNLILASNASVTTNIDATLISPGGSTLATKSYSVPPNGMTQINRVVRDMGVSEAITGARLVLSSTTSGSVFTGFASVIDETTNDPTTVLVQPASVSGSAPFTWLLPTSAHSGGAHGALYTTNLSVSNVGAAPASFTMKFLGNNQDGSGGPEQLFNLESGRSVTYIDVLGSVFNETSNFGAIRITSDNPALNIVSVTSTPGFGGTFGQTIPAISTGDLIPTGSSRSILYIREGDGFRSNLILASNASVSTMVDAALVSPDSTTLATKSYSVPANGMTQINRVVRDMGVSGAITGARLVLSSSTPGASFTGIASVIDETTNDPTTVEAK